MTSNVRLLSAARTAVGNVRTVNEDRLLDQSDHGFWAIADGMGGHRHGGAAAERLIEALSGVEHGSSGYLRLAEISAAVDTVNNTLFHQTRETEGPSGSTLVAVLIHDTHLACLWAGDSRAYLLRSGVLHRLTHDHSRVQELVDAGLVEEAARRGHPHGHLITRAVGVGPSVQLDQRFEKVEEGDVLLLCSDGLSACLDDAEIAEKLRVQDLGAAADSLLEEALLGSAPDNISFIIVRASSLGSSRGLASPSLAPAEEVV